MNIKFNNVDPKHDGFAFRCPADLCVTTILPKRVLLIGQCTADHVRLFLTEIGIECDFVHIQSLIDPSFSPPNPIESYDLQIVFLPMDRIIPPDSFFHLPYDISAEEERYGVSELNLHQLLDQSTRWLTTHNILTLVGNFLIPQQNPMGKLLPRNDLRNPCYFMEKLNESLTRRIDETENAYVIDIDGLASTFGKKYLTDDFIWSITHGGFITNVEYENYEVHREGVRSRLEPLGPIGEYYSVKTHEGYLALREEILSMYRCARQADVVKIVVIDLDDTAWRGIAAEEEDNSHEFMTLGWPIGFVETLMFLKRRGVLLGIISKNDPDNAQKAWDRAYGSIFPISNFVSVKVNWLPKHENMRQILSETNLLAQNAVYIDDNPAEREIIQANFPGIRVIGSNPYYTRRILLWSPETQVPFISAESSFRTESIKSVIKRESDRALMDHGEFLKSLNLQCRHRVIGDVAHNDFKRCFELVNKTNQFNTTGKRWSLEEITAELAEGTKIFAFDVDDRFTHYGIVCVALVRHDSIKQFVMSCRVIGLGVEMAAMAVILNEMKAIGIGSVTADTLKTEKNVLSRDLFARASFRMVNEHHWERCLNDAISTPEHMVLQSA